MGLELEAFFPEDGIFFAGDSFTCVLTFTNTEVVPPPLDTSVASNSNDSPKTAPPQIVSPSNSKDDATVKEEKTNNRISFTQMVRKSISLSSLRTIIPLGQTPEKKPSMEALGEVAEEKEMPYQGVRRRSLGAVRTVPPLPVVSVAANAAQNGNAGPPPSPSTHPANHLLSPSMSKAPKLTVAPPSLHLNVKSLDAHQSTKKTTPVTPTSLPKNPLNDAPLRSLSMDLPRHVPESATTSPNEDTALLVDSKQEWEKQQQIQLTNVDDFEDRSASRLSMMSLNSAAPSPRPLDRSNSPLPFSDSYSPPKAPQILTSSMPPPAKMPDLSFREPLEGSKRKINVKSEELAWAFAQMTGHITVDSSYVKTSALESLKSRAMYNVGGAGPGGGGSMGGSSLGLDAFSKPYEKVFPLYSTPPSILFYDLSLEPGETRSFKYEITLPNELPPTHRGKIIRFSYKLIVGIQRSGTSKRSQVIQLPFRMFGKVEGDGSKLVYDILNPVIVNTEEAIITPVNKANAFPKSKPLIVMHDDEKLTLMQNLTLICQRSGKLSFDICKNNEHVAQLKLTRGVYRLGEIITGILDFSKSTIPCYQVSAFLENSESVDAPYAIKPKPQMLRATRRVFAEQHRYTVNVSRTGISLPIPLGCTPDFKTSGVSMSWVLRLEFITGLSNSLLTPAASDINFIHMNVMNHADVEAFDCLIPIEVFPTKMVRKAVVRTFEIV
ncbi:hypothetical protein HDU97_005971 [Phlyctochytrium planicorne]|nr:hypothetical protein HDU97_005971 [Phlyctochytrium planicorne]